MLVDIILDNQEGKPETVTWRNSRLALWAKIRERRDADFTSAAKFTSADAARKYAMERARGEVQIFLAEIFRRSSAKAAATFVSEAPFGWWDRAEILLDTGELVPSLIRRSYPSPSFASKLQELEQAQAKIGLYWGPWIRHWLKIVEQETGIAIDNAAQAASDAADTLWTWGEYAAAIIKYGPPVLVGTVVVAGIVFVARKS